MFSGGAVYRHRNSCLAKARQLAADGKTGASSLRPSDFISQAIRSMNMQPHSAACASTAMPSLRIRRKTDGAKAARRCQLQLRIVRSAAQRPVTALPSSASLMPTGQFEAICFSDTLNAAREMLEPGTSVIVSVEADVEGEEVKLRLQGVEALDKAAAAVVQGVQIFVRDAAPCRVHRQAT